MDILVNRTSSATEKKEEKRPPPRKEKKRERRRAGRDRRKSVNEGVVISLSSKGERRRYRDRRQQNTVEAEFHLPEEETGEPRGKFSVVI